LKYHVLISGFSCITPEAKYRLFTKAQNTAAPVFDCYTHPNLGHSNWQKLVSNFRKFWRSTFFSSLNHPFDSSQISEVFQKPPFWFHPLHDLPVGQWPPTMIAKWAGDVSAGKSLSFSPSPLPLYPITSFAPTFLDLENPQVSFIFLIFLWSSDIIYRLRGMRTWTWKVLCQIYLTFLKTFRSYQM
jgi:hypothetical protein